MTFVLLGIGIGLILFIGYLLAVGVDHAEYLDDDDWYFIDEEFFEDDDDDEVA